jgi:hypothetical protein
MADEEKNETTEEPAAEPPVRDSGPGEGAPGEPEGSPAAASNAEEPAAEAEEPVAEATEETTTEDTAETEEA